MQAGLALGSILKEDDVDFAHESRAADEFGGGAELYIKAAEKAARENHKRLAIHLYIAAFEQESVNNVVPSQVVLDGMGSAWDIACEIGDKSSAETIFMQLSPYSSPEQVQKRVRQLQEMAVNQLKQMGIPDDCIERLSPMDTPSAAQVETAAAQTEETQDGEDAGSGSEGGDGDIPNPFELLRQLGGTAGVAAEPKKYADLVGYDSELKQMCVYGFESAGSREFQRFIKEAAEFHGVDGMSLSDPFVIQGPSRDDLYEFAEATAGEIGNPIVSLHVRTDDEGIWTMRLSGPFKKGIFGTADPCDVPMPCTFIVENIDLLQEFIKASINNETMGFGSGDAPYPYTSSRGYGEVLGYVHTMMNKPGVFAIATSATTNIEFVPQLGELFAGARMIDVGYPNLEERKTIWEEFAAEHASFATVNLDALSEISAGVSRHDLVSAGRNAVRSAFQRSIGNNDYEFVEINDVLYELVPFVSDDKLGFAIEEAAAKAFSGELETLLSDIDDQEDGEA